MNQASNLVSLPYAVGVSAANVNDFGAFNATFSQGFGTGSGQLTRTITFRLDAATVSGNYAISFGWNQPSLVGGSSPLFGNGTEYQIDSPLSALIAVVPEPHTAGLIAGAARLLMVGFRPFHRKEALAA